MGIDPRIVNHFPPAGSTIRRRDVRFDFFDDDVSSPLHVGRLDHSKTNVEVDYGDGRGYQPVITAGEVTAPDGYCEFFMMPGSRTGGRTGGQMTGRRLQQARVKHKFEKSVPDGTRVTYHVQAEDAAGNTLDDIFYFDTWAWTHISLPRLEFYTEAGTLAGALQFYLHEFGTQEEQTWNLWWGKGCSVGPGLQRVEIEISGGTKNATGKEYIDEEYIIVNSQTVGLTPIVLSGMSLNSYQAVTIGLDTDADAVSSGLCALQVKVTPFANPGTGSGPTGRERTGGTINFRGRYKRPQQTALIIYGQTPERKAFWAECGFT